MNGDIFGSLVAQYTLSINDGSIPNIESSWQYICREENTKAQQYAEEVFLGHLRAIRQKMPAEEALMQVELKTAKEMAL